MRYTSHTHFLGMHNIDSTLLPSKSRARSLLYLLTTPCRVGITPVNRVPASCPRRAKHACWAIVGAGLTGLAAARQLALNFPDDEVVLVEAQDVGYGSSGRATPVSPLMFRTISGRRIISVMSPPRIRSSSQHPRAEPPA